MKPKFKRQRKPIEVLVLFANLTHDFRKMNNEFCLHQFNAVYGVINQFPSVPNSQI